MRFLVNSPRKRKAKRAGRMASVRRHGKAVSRAAWKASGFARNAPKRRKRRKLAGAALAAHNKKKAGRSRTRTARRRVQASTSGGSKMAKRKRRRTTSRRRRRSTVARRTRRNPSIRHRRRSSRRRFRRNPPMSGRGLVKVATQGIKDAALILVGKAATRAVSSMVPFGANVGIVGAGKQVLVSLAVGYAAHKALGADAARMVVAGGIAAPLETLVKGLNIPILSANLGDATGAAGSALAIGNQYPYPVGDGMAAYPLSAYPADDMGYADHAVM